MVPNSRFTLLPHGPVPSSNESREQCDKLLAYCDADSQRYHDQRFTNLDQFIRYASRFDDLQDRETPALVAFTQTCPLIQTVFNARQRLCEKLPALENALWVIYVDPALDPGFGQTATRLGHFDASLDSAPVFESNDGCNYLVLTPQTTAYEYVRMRSRLMVPRATPSSTLGKSPNDTSRSRTNTRAVVAHDSQPPASKP